MGFRGKVGIKSEFCDLGSWVLLGIRLENRIAAGFRIEADLGPTTGSGLFLPPSYFPEVRIVQATAWGPPGTVNR